MGGRLTFTVCWHGADGRTCSTSLRVGEDGADGMLGLSLVCEEVPGGSLWRLVAAPAARGIRVTSVCASLRCDLSHADALYLNGYNSWTDSWERPVRSRMRNFGVPRAVIERWVLDGSGDYRFTRKDERRGHQHGFGYGYLRFGDEVELVGSLSEDTGLTTLWEDLPAGTLTLEKEPPAASLAAGKERELLSFCILYGGLGEVTPRWIGLMGRSARPCKPMVGYTSWYRHYTDIDATKLSHDLEGVAQQLDRFDTSGCAKAFQVDDGYAKVGDWGSPDAAKFPRGLAPLAHKVSEMGMLAGIWLAPFVCERGSRIFAERPEWLLRDERGEPVVTGSHWSGQVAFDTRNPEFRAHLLHVLRTYTETWGFGLLKCDFLYAACMLPHDGMNRGELMADALELLRDGAGESTWLDLCGVPLVSAFGRAEFCRIGCDVGLDWDDKPHMRLTGRERVSTKRSLGNTKGRAHLDGVAFRNDPDVLFLRPDVRLTDEQRASLLDADATLGGVLFTSDDMALWDACQTERYRCALARFVGRAGKERAS